MTTYHHVFPNREVQVMCRNQVKVVQEGVLARQSFPSFSRHFEWPSTAGADVSRSHGGGHQAVPEDTAGWLGQRAARRTVSAERLRFTPSSPSADAPAAPEPAQLGLCSGLQPGPAWGAVPAMPDLEGRGPGTEKVEEAKPEAPSGLLGSIIEDVAQLSAQVDKLLSRRKDVLKGTGPRYCARASSDVRDAALELSRSDSSAAEGDAIGYKGGSNSAGARASGGV
ncbi:unnamed protein product [Symbiodinium sp. CCMP2592]|nr:unnamed protein product [Symbiodinium sp. CCMP2592]